MLTQGDEYPIHQTPEPIAYSGSDRNFYDRYFFNGYTRDGALFFAAALGVYPHLNIIDGAFSILKDGRQASLHVSRPLGMERMDTSVGPLRIEVVEPLKRIRLVLQETDGLSAQLEFEGRAFPIEEPRFTYRNGPRMLIDCTRMTQNGRWTGHVSLDGETIDMSASNNWGTRDRSWGVRPIGAADAQPTPPIKPPQFYWIWTPLNFEDRSVFFHVNEDGAGKPWNTRALEVADGAGAEDMAHMASCKADLQYTSGTRRASSAALAFTDAQGHAVGVELTPLATFHMKGIGYTHPEWGHGAYKGEQLAVAREDFSSDLDWARPDHLHIQALSKAVFTDSDGAKHEGMGAFEQLFIGPHEPSGFRDILDAPA